MIWVAAVAATVMFAIIAVALWIVVGFLGFSVILNAISRSKIERIWAPVCAIALAAVTTVNLLAA